MTAICITLCLLCGCGNGCHDNRGTSLKVAVLRGPSAVESVWLADSISGMRTASVEIFDEPLMLRKAMVRGEVDFAMLPTSMAALMYNKGIGYRMAAVPVWGSLYLCGTDTTVRSLADLQGRKVHLMARGMTPDVLFRYLLARSGVSVELDYRFHTHIDLANAAISGRADLCVLSEPYVSQTAARNPYFRPLLDLGEQWRLFEGMPLPETAFLCRRGVPDSTVRAVLGALQRSADRVRAEPDSAAALAARAGINPDVAAVRASIPLSNLYVVPAEQAEKEINHYLRVLLGASPEAIGNRMPDEAFIFK